MTITLEQTEKLLNGDYRFSQAGFSTLITRLKGLYAIHPNQAFLQTSMDEINVFLSKFKDAMADDYEIISAI